METKKTPVPKPLHPAAEALVHETLGRVADKWTLLVIDALGERGELRFSRLRGELGGVSQKMLTKTLRQLERDGLVRRRVHAEVPPRVEYKLTPRGYKLGEAVCSIWRWVDANAEAIERSRRAYDARQVRPSRASAHVRASRDRT